MSLRECVVDWNLIGRHHIDVFSDIFQVVETVDYQPWEVGNFPPPTNPQEVGARVLMQRRIESAPAPVASSQKAKVDENREG